MIPLNTEIAGLKIGDQQTFRNLTIVPIFRKQTPPEPLSQYDLLDEAIAAGTAHVTELHEGGSVPELRFENLGNRPVLLLDGQELIGAKQNRVLNLTILAPAKSTIVIPVSCVEAGRWHSVGSEFKPADHVMYSRVRAARAAQVTDCMRSVGLRRSDQSAVWADIEAKASQLDALSPTSAMSAIYDRNAMTVEEYTRSFTCKSGQCGMAFQVTAGEAGFDLFDRPETMRHFFGRLLKSYALDAMESPTHEAGDSNRVLELFAGIASTQSFTEPAVGLGKDVRLNSPGIAGAALWAENRYIHICAFSTKTHSQFSSRVCRPSRRWR